LTAAERNAVLNELLSLGYTQQEIDGALPANWAAVTLEQVLRFASRRRLKPRYDVASDTIVLDGPQQPVKDIVLVVV
jgi:predicted Zn-dependent peptidase